MSPVSSFAVDVHTHVVPSSFPRSLHGSAGWPSMQPAQGCHRNIVIDGKVYRTLSDPCWDMGKRAADMDRMRITLQVLSPMPELLSYWLPIAAADDLLRYINDQLAGFIAQGAGRFVGLGAVPLQDIDRALTELTRLSTELGFVGVEVGSNINGVPIGSPQFDPFFAEAERLGAAVLVHAVRPSGMDRLVGPKQLQQVLAYPTDVGLAAASMITANTLCRFPRLRVAFSHGGGTLASLMPRLAEGVRAFAELRDCVHEDVWIQARRFFYDSLVYDVPTLRHLLRVFGEDQLMIGSDYPFAFHDRAPVDHVYEASANETLQRKLLCDNARRFLNRNEG